MHVAGNITCDRIGTVPREIWLNGAGQARSGAVNFWQNFGVTMYNVPRDPWVTRADIKCSGNNGTYWFSRSFWAFRPGVGEQMNVNFRG